MQRSLLTAPAITSMTASTSVSNAMTSPVPPRVRGRQRPAESGCPPTEHPVKYQRRRGIHLPFREGYHEQVAARVAAPIEKGRVPSSDQRRTAAFLELLPAPARTRGIASHFHCSRDIRR